MYYEKTDTPTTARSWNLSDDLGQVEYIFSDKTGTLTQVCILCAMTPSAGILTPTAIKNSMLFRQCSIGGRVYKGDPAPPANGEEDEKASVMRTSSSSEAPQPAKIDLTGPESSEPSIAIVTDGPNRRTERIRDLPVRFVDTALLQDLEAGVSDNLNPEMATHTRLLNGFFSVLALCHTVLASVDPETGEIEYKAQSPDEAALVQAAADVGFVFCGRDKETLSLRTPSTTPDVEKYELLNILEFTSARKRMSVVLRKLGGEDGRLFLLTKGADNVIFERLRSSEDQLKVETEAHLSEFANEGLRTLTLAYKIIGGECSSEMMMYYP